MCFKFKVVTDLVWAQLWSQHSVIDFYLLFVKNFHLNVILTLKEVFSFSKCWLFFYINLFNRIVYFGVDVKSVFSLFCLLICFIGTTLRLHNIIKLCTFFPEALKETFPGLYFFLNVFSHVFVQFWAKVVFVFFLYYFRVSTTLRNCVCYGSHNGELFKKTLIKAQKIHIQIFKHPLLSPRPFKMILADTWSLNTFFKLFYMWCNVCHFYSFPDIYMERYENILLKIKTRLQTMIHLFAVSLPENM